MTSRFLFEIVQGQVRIIRFSFFLLLPGWILQACFFRFLLLFLQVLLVAFQYLYYIFFLYQGVVAGMTDIVLKVRLIHRSVFCTHQIRLVLFFVLQ